MLRFIGFVIASLLAWPVAAQDMWKLDAQSATCILQNITLYEQAAEDPIVIFVKACPIVDRAAAIQSLQMNTALPTLKENSVGALGLDEVIVFTRQELACLRNMVVPEGTPVIGIPKSPRCNG